MICGRSRLRPAAGFFSVGEGSLQSCVTLFPNYRPFKLSPNHLAGVAVGEFSESRPCQRPLAGRISVFVPGARPRYFLSDSAQTIPNQRFPVFGALIPRGARSVRESEKEDSANKNASSGHGGLGSVRASTL
jgi:hypothetical protein